MKRILRWIGGVLFASGIVLLGYCAMVLADGWRFERQQSHYLKPAPAAEQLPNGLIGRIEIPRLGISVIVMEGDDTGVLRRAAGHIPGTSLPGRPGNVGISAHRDTFFRPLRNVRKDDVITLATRGGEYRYRVVSTRIVTPEHIEVLDAGEKESLTLVTCYPFYFVGPAPKRFIVRAERIA